MLAAARKARTFANHGGAESRSFFKVFSQCLRVSVVHALFAAGRLVRVRGCVKITSLFCPFGSLFVDFVDECNFFIKATQASANNVSHAA